MDSKDKDSAQLKAAGAQMTPEEKKKQREQANKLKAEKKAKAAAKKLGIETEEIKEPPQPTKPVKLADPAPEKEEQKDAIAVE